jgi:uncharacterized protein (TIGR03663 family)
MKWHSVQPFLFVIILIFAASLRLPQLAMRPMHGDEAVNAIKFGILLEEGNYNYDPHEYHGPTLYYFSLIPTWIGSITTLNNLSEVSLRIVPVIFGLLTIYALFWLRNSAGGSLILLAALILAVSPIVVFYNRYYIHESMLVCFSWAFIICGYLYVKKRSWLLAVLNGILLGFLIATKETWIIFFGSALLSLILIYRIRNILSHISLKHFIIFSSCALGTIVLFYSSFFNNPAGIIDAVSAYSNYVSVTANNELHLHPWYYYLNLLLYFKMGGFPFWSESIILILAFFGFLIMLSRSIKSVHTNNLLKFITIYTILLIIIFSIIPYKTPWNFLGVMPGLIVMAAYTMIELRKLIPGSGKRLILDLIFTVALIHLTWQSWQLNYIYHASQANPYVYAHPTKDVFEIKQKIEQVLQKHPAGNNLHIQVIAPGNDYWPLPWYLRDCNKIGWWDHVPEQYPVAPLIIVAAKLEPQLINRLYEIPPPGQRDLYLPLFDRYTDLRPGIEMRAYIRKEDWDLTNTSE